MEREFWQNILKHFQFDMILLQVIAVFHVLFDVIGLPGNLLVLVTIVLERRFHVMRYILLASLAVSDFLFLILGNSFRIASIAQEPWLYGETMCHLSPFFARYFYMNTVLHLVAVSYERYHAIVKSPLTYDGTITKSKVTVIALIWVIPVPFSIGPFLGFGKFVCNPEVLFCQQGWTAPSGSSGWRSILSVMLLVIPLLVIVILNWSVIKTTRNLQVNAVDIQVGNLAGSENQFQEMSRRRIERKAAVDVGIIIAAFLLCFLPVWVVGICRQFSESTDVPAEAVLITFCIAMVSTLCNPIIYSIRKRDFRTAVKKVLRRVGVCGISNDVISINNPSRGANRGTEAFTLNVCSSTCHPHQDGRLSSIQEIQQIEEASPNDIENSMTSMNNLRFSANLDKEASTPNPTAALATRHQDGRLSPIQEMEEASTNDIENNVSGMNNSWFSANLTKTSTSTTAVVFVTQHQDERVFRSEGTA